ncbi:hypothetical protein IC229_29885 [Spirosoma sp. BT702]|uniref:Uncharacterized protein n=1 Tax=Spirosoma profusum TaxID=2771354 RepID=A0A927AUY2_9BACT|nr:hypothetical protein [Spirosoma profusum]MBD2704880.1 hypothetical protein [Spirosoma profusum]
MTKSTKLLLFFLGLAGISWAVYECKYYVSYYADLSERPWAYSRDENAKLLVGTWQGEFHDPDNVLKTIRLTIVKPMTDEERAQKASRRTRKRSGLGSRADKQHFDGTANVTSKFGNEVYDLSGHVETRDGHRLDVIHFQGSDETGPLRNNFNVALALEGGQWQNDDLTLTLAFTFTTNTGSGYSSSADPRYDKKITVHLTRIKS